MADILIAGVSGGREHALGEALSGNNEHQLAFTHGNPGTENVGLNLGLTSNSEIVDYVDKMEPDLVVIGPEAPLVEGLADKLRYDGVAVFGPGSDGAKLESSKGYAVEFMKQYGINHPESLVTSNLVEALEYNIGHIACMYVIKADGLAGGKGVKLPNTQGQAETIIRNMMSGDMFGEAGKTLVLQERKSGPEVSAFLVTDGKKHKLIGIAQDHKRLEDGDRGPNTGGMGAYLPVPFATDQLIDEINDIGDRTLFGLKDRGIDYRGVLYLGLMLDEEDDGRPTMMEYNVRFGDPETQPLFVKRAYAHLNDYELLHSAARGNLIEEPEFGAGGIEVSAVTVCLAALGYPDSTRKDGVIRGLDNYYDHVSVHQGGTKQVGEDIVVAGGRVLYVTGIGETVDEAAAYAYASLGEENNGIYIEGGGRYRTDIAHQARNQ